MIIRVKRTAKDRPLVSGHKTWSRREFIERGICTTTMAATLPHALLATMAKSAYAGGTVCPAAVATPGGLAQIHGPGGGFSIASYGLNMQQLNMAPAGSSAANLWGIAGGTNLSQVFSNGGVDITSPFGNAITTPPPGITAAAWTAALAQVAMGSNFGTASQDDGGGEQLGHLGASSPVKNSTLNEDIAINANGITLAPWATAMKAATAKIATSSQKLTSASLAGSFGIAPAAGTNGSIFANAASAGSSLGNMFTAILGANRAGGATAMTAASCGFTADAQMASATFGTNLFTPANISSIVASGVTLGTLTAQEQAFLAAYYQSAVGEIGGVTSVNPGADYHNQSVQTTISPYDQNLGIQFRMWLLAAMIAQKPAAMIITTNGTPGPNGVQNVTINSVTGAATTTVAVNGASAQGDDGGSFSNNQVFLYSPTGKTPPKVFSTGTIGSDGTVKPDARITTVPQAIASHYLTALTFMGFNTTTFLNILAANGVGTPVNLLTG